jgi:hypothetical protein
MQADLIERRDGLMKLHPASRTISGFFHDLVRWHVDCGETTAKNVDLPLLYERTP